MTFNESTTNDSTENTAGDTVMDFEELREYMRKNNAILMCKNYRKHCGTSKCFGVDYSNEITGEAFEMMKAPPWLMVIDIDIHKDENHKPQREAWKYVRELTKTKITHLKTSIIQTASGGLHIYARASPELIEKDKKTKYYRGEFFDVDIFGKTNNSQRLVIPDTVIRIPDDFGEFYKYEILKNEKISITARDVLEFLGIPVNINKNKNNEEPRNVERFNEINPPKFEGFPAVSFLCSLFVKSRLMLHNWNKEEDDGRASVFSLFSRAVYVYKKETQINKTKFKISDLNEYLEKLKNLLTLSDDARDNYARHIENNQKKQYNLSFKNFIKFADFFPILYAEEFKKFKQINEKKAEIFEKATITKKRELIALPDKIDDFTPLRFGSIEFNEIARRSANYTNAGELLRDLSGCIRIKTGFNLCFFWSNGFHTLKKMELSDELKPFKTTFKDVKNSLNLWEFVKNFFYLLKCDSVEFFTDDPSKISIFSGYAVEPEQNDEYAAAFVNFVRELVKPEGENIARSLINWAAFIVQNIDGKTGTVPILRGVYGCGKTTFGEILAQIIGEKHAKQKDTLSSIGESFNSDLTGKKLIIFNEIENVTAFSSNIENKFKTLITDSSMDINEKNKPRFSCSNVLNFIGFSNYENPVKIREGQRRFWVCECSDDVEKMRDLCANFYESPAKGTIKKDILKAVLYYLTHLDLSGYNPKELPQTLANDSAESRGILLSKIAPIIGPLIGRFFEHSGNYICEKITFTPQELKTLRGSSYTKFKQIMINRKRSYFVEISPRVYKILLDEYGGNVL